MRKEHSESLSKSSLVSEANDHSSSNGDGKVSIDCNNCKSYQKLLKFVIMITVLSLLLNFALMFVFFNFMLEWNFVSKLFWYGNMSLISNYWR